MIIIHTPTIEDYIEVLEWALDQNMLWNSGNDSIHEDYWYVNESETYVIIKNEILSYSRGSYILGNFKETDIVNMTEFRKNNREFLTRMFGKKFDLR